MNRWLVWSLLGVLAASAIVLAAHGLITGRSLTLVAASIQALATVGLVAVTWQYSRLVETQADAAKSTAEATRKSAEATEKSAEATQRSAALMAQERRRRALRVLTEIQDSLGGVARTSGNRMNNTGRPSDLVFSSDQMNDYQDKLAQLPPDIAEDLHGAYEMMNQVRNKAHQLRRALEGGGDDQTARRAYETANTKAVQVFDRCKSRAERAEFELKREMGIMTDEDDA